MDKIDVYNINNRVKEVFEKVKNEHSVTNFSKILGYTTTRQLYNVFDNKNLITTKALYKLFSHLNVNPNYIFFGRDSIFKREEEEFDRISDELETVTKQKKELMQKMILFVENGRKLEERNYQLQDNYNALIETYKSRIRGIINKYGLKDEKAPENRSDIEQLKLDEQLKAMKEFVDGM